MSLWEQLLGRKVVLKVREDNQATIRVVKNGYSPKLRHIQRTHKVNLGSICEIFENEACEISYVATDEQAADIFTKCLEPIKWDNALELLGMSPHSH